MLARPRKLEVSVSTLSNGMKTPPAKTLRMTRAAREITIAMLGLFLPIMSQKVRQACKQASRQFVNDRPSHLDFVAHTRKQAV